jgi:hypothetical protein
MLLLLDWVEVSTFLAFRLAAGGRHLGMSGNPDTGYLGVSMRTAGFRTFSHSAIVPHTYGARKLSITLSLR